MEDKGRPNRSKRIDQYLRAAKLDPERASYPWCAAFVTWCLMEAALRLGRLKFRGSASVSNLLARNPELRLPSGAKPWPGDIFLHISPAGNHCGFVTRPVPLPGGIVGLATLEGNTDEKGGRTGGKVMHRSRPPGYATAFLRPA